MCFNKRRRGFNRIEDSVDASIPRLEGNKKNEQKRQITATGNCTGNIKTNRTTITRKQKCEEKLLCEYFKQQTGEIEDERTWRNLQRETESVLIETQNNAIKLNHIKTKIY